MVRRITFICLMAMFGVITSCTPETYDTYCTISGTVIDLDTGEPIQQATVTLSPSGLNTYTGYDGNFEFLDLDAKQYTVTVQKTGYSANRKTVTTIPGNVVNVSLTMQKNQ